MLCVCVHVCVCVCLQVSPFKCLASEAQYHYPGNFPLSQKLLNLEGFGMLPLAPDLLLLSSHGSNPQVRVEGCSEK